MGIDVYQFEDKEVEEIDGRDTRAVVSKLNSLLGQSEEEKLGTIQRLFDAGCLIAKPNLELSVREITEITGLKSAYLNSAKKVAEKFNCDREKFMETVKVNGWSSWNEIRSHYSPKIKRESDELDSVLTIVKAHAREYRENRKDNQKRTQLKLIAGVINRIIPVDVSLRDTAYFQYHPCVCCGNDEPPAEGFELVLYDKMESIKYPICEECKAVGSEPVMSYLLIMYVNYAINLEQAFDRLLL